MFILVSPEVSDEWATGTMFVCNIRLYNSV